MVTRVGIGTISPSTRRKVLRLSLFFFPMRIELIRLKSTAAGYRFIPAPLSADEAARRGLGPGSGWDKAFGHGISS